MMCVDRLAYTCTGEPVLGQETSEATQRMIRLVQGDFVRDLEPAV